MELYLINKIINLWDPYGVIGLAPMDEYKDISLRIFDIIKEKNKEIKINLYNYLKLVDVLKTTNDTKMIELIDLLIEIHEKINL